uniref:DDE_Tnp_1_7 domain-containing protein n=1 Tax=Glossina austeni TaxID=7395 RepID=A0A1A9UE02_GLOAU
MVTPVASNYIQEKDILEQRLNKWYDIYADNLYNSVDFIKYIYSVKTRICGTIRTNRGLPAILKQINVNVNKYIRILPEGSSTARNVKMQQNFQQTLGDINPQMYSTVQT